MGTVARLIAAVFCSSAIFMSPLPVLAGPFSWIKCGNFFKSQAALEREANNAVSALSDFKVRVTLRGIRAGRSVSDDALALYFDSVWNAYVALEAASKKGVSREWHNNMRAHMVEALKGTAVEPKDFSGAVLEKLKNTKGVLGMFYDEYGIIEMPGLYRQLHEKIESLK
ncbi:MAG: hypothetical protein HYW49_08460 [Deltaproteobacteria bacterium]|nr:hypothetical protein [Deltaproteobacteria bacterium]